MYGRALSEGRITRSNHITLEPTQISNSFRHFLVGYDKFQKGSYLWHRSMFMNMKEYGKVQIMNQKGFINLRAIAEFEKM
jgi:hypothetical protein